MIYEDDIRAIDPEYAAEPRWPDFVALVRESGIAVTEEALAALPFAVEIGDDVLERITR